MPSRSFRLWVVGDFFLRGEMALVQSGDNLIQMFIRTCKGRLTAQEVLGHEEFVPGIHSSPPDP